MKQIIYSAAVLGLVAGLYACGDEPPAVTESKPESAVESTQAAAPAPVAAQPADPHAGLQHPPMPGNTGQGGTAAQNAGRVLNVLQTASYSYLEVDSNGRPVWLASGRVDVAPGMQVNWGDYAVMRNFTSKALNRTFEEILFVSSVVAGAPRPAAAAAGESGEVIKVDNAGGYSYVRVRNASGEKWLAAPLTAVAAGDKVNWQGGAEMHNFNSKSLNRSFDKIVFVGGLDVTR